MSASAGMSARGSVATWLAFAVAAMATWVALTDSVKLQELIAGIVVAATVATLLSLVERTDGPARTRPTRVRAGDLLGPPARLVSDMPMLLVVLWRRIRHGEPIAGALRIERTEAPLLVNEWWGSLAPSRYVIGTEEEAGRALVHELRPRAPGSRG